MEKRTIIIGNYDTASHGWTLASWTLSPPKVKTSFVDKPYGDGAWDLSTVLTGGIPCYNSRELTISLELSEGTRMDRETVIRQMVSVLDGLRWDIHLPDDDHHHIKGRVSVAREYNNLAHAAVTITATCDPWKYSDFDTVVVLSATTAERTAQLVNGGRRAVVPTMTVEGGEVLLKYGTGLMTMAAGTYQWPVLMLTPGAHAITYSGTGTLTVTYREAVLE